MQSKHKESNSTKGDKKFGKNSQHKKNRQAEEQIVGSVAQHDQSHRISHLINY